MDLGIILIITVMSGILGGLIGIEKSISRLTKSLASDNLKIQFLLTDIRDRLSKEGEGKVKE